MGLDLGRRSIVEWAEAAPEEEAAEFVPAAEKFTIEAPIGRGGMGEVFLVSDQDLKRQVAMKVLRADTGQGREQRLHFISEAQATSQLEHPGIPPVHDIGKTADGRPYFTMKLVRGRTLREVLHDLVLKRREVAREYNLHRLVTIIERLAETLQFSHERGVVHRDIKPENIMLGDYGEVHLMDWGLARVGTETSEAEEQVETARTESGLETQYGALKGTLPYMSPEQAIGEPVDGRTDLYALGCLLYEVLTLHPAFDPQDRELLVKVQTGSFPDVMKRNPRRKVPDSLAAICRRAMTQKREERYATAAEMRKDLRRWLDGRAEKARRHEEAEKLAEKGKQSAARYTQLKIEVDEAERAAAAEEGKYKPYQPVSEKRTLITARKRVEELKTQVALAFAETTHLLNAALTQEADNSTARAALAELWRKRLDEAEPRGEKADTAHALAMLERYSDDPIPSGGTLALESDPPGAQVVLYRFVERDGVLTPEEERDLGTTPLGPVALEMGSYLCILKKEGFREVRYPVHIPRERDWKGTVRLRTDEEIGEDFVYVPGGPFVYGEGKETAVKELPDFAIARYPVTFREYLEFLETLDDEEAKKRMPQTPGDGPYVEGDADGHWRVLPNLVEGEAKEACLQRYGEDFDLLCPVIGVSWHDAVAYCEWKSRTTGKEWRLPTEGEREKASRGVDGRRFAWGDLVDSSLGKCRDSRPESSQPEPVGAFSTAESVYGMGDASGGVWDWTDSWYDERRSSRVLRGGSWTHELGELHCADRGRNEPRYRSSYIGFRCARGL